jgi:YfiH family protein
MPRPGMHPFIEPDWPAPANVLALSTTRDGGHRCRVSDGIYRGLNMGHHVGDDPAAVAANRELLLGRLPPGAEIQWLSQIHGTTAVEAGAVPQYSEADASWSREAGLACAVLTADCLPVLLCDRGGTVVAAAHAGWRGLLGGVLESTIAAMAVAPGELLVWLGPAIGAGAFEVGPEVKSAFLAAADTGSRSGVASCFSRHPQNPGHYNADH